MPGNLLMAVVGWLASHLIVFTLLGFVVVGVMLYQGEYQGDSTVSTAQRAPDPLPDRIGDPEPGTPAESAQRAAVEPRPASEPGRPRQPKLIGGSLPVYQHPPGESRARGGDAVDGFRPPEVLPAPPAQADSYEMRIQAARKAYWNGEFELAESHYVDLVTAYPDDADAFGELGNLYETMGEWELAKDAYFAAGERLKLAGETEKLRHVIELLEKKGDARAQRLRKP